MTTTDGPTLGDLRSRRDEILLLAADHRVSNVRVIGALARGEAPPAGEVDLLVDFQPAGGALDLFAFAAEVEELIGHHVNIGTVVDARVRDRVEAEAVAL